MSEAITFTFTFWDLFWLIISSAILMIARAWIAAHYGVQVKGWKDIVEFVFGEGAEGVTNVVPIIREALSKEATMLAVPVPANEENMIELVKSTKYITETLGELVVEVNNLTADNDRIFERLTALEMNKVDKPERAKEEEAELKILMEFMPEQMSESEITQIVEKAISDTGAESMKDIGKVMGQVMPQVKGKADGKLVNEIARGKFTPED